MVGFEQDPDGVVAALNHTGVTSPIRARYLIGCDGGHSVVRKTLGVRLEGETIEGQRVLIADVEIPGLSRERWHVWPLATGAMVTLCPLPGTSLFQLAAPLEARTPDPELGHEGVVAFISRALGPRLQIAKTTWSSLYRPHVRMVDRYRVGSVFLAGDAAHVHPPAGGQGLNTGIQDAYNLGWKLAEVLRGAPDSLLDSYSAERLPVAADVLGLSKRLHVAGSRTRGDETKQLDIGYRDSPLNDSSRLDASDPRSSTTGLTSRSRGRPAEHSSGSLQPGDRAPDARVNGGTSESLRLFDLFRGPHFTLLVAGNTHESLLAQLGQRWGNTLRLDSRRVRTHRVGLPHRGSHPAA